MFRCRIPLDFVLDINAYDVHNADSLAQQTQKIEEHGSVHAHHHSHVSFKTNTLHNIQFCSIATLLDGSNDMYPLFRAIGDT